MKTFLLLFLLFILFPVFSYAATCDAGYWLDSDGTCAACGVGGHNFIYCVGDDLRYDCPTLSDSNLLSHLHRYYTWSTGKTATQITSCRIFLKGYDVENGVIAFSTAFRPDLLLEYNGINWSYAGYASAEEYYRLNWDMDNPSDYGYIAPIKSYQIENTESYCDAGYYGRRGNVNYTFSSYETMLKYNHCVVVGHGYYSPQKKWGRTKCPLGTYTQTNISHSVEQCLPCTNAPLHSTYTDADTNDINDCPWECDAGYGLTAANTCEPLCTADMTQMKTSNGLSYNIYTAKHTRPAIHLFRNNTICFIDLAPGYESGAMNLQHGENIYHATN